MYNVELRVRVLLRHQVVEFVQLIRLPFVPIPCLFYHEGPPPIPSLRFREVGWLAAEEKFLVQTDDDVDTVAEFGDDVEALVAWYESMGWEVFNSGPIAFVVVEPDEDDEEDTLMEDDWSDLQKFLGGESA
jgi:hypothetical protein